MNELDASNGNPPARTGALQRFAAFVRQECIQKFIEREIELFKSMEIPLWELIQHLPDQQIFDMTKESGERFLLALENNSYKQHIIDNFSRWEKDELGIVTKSQISLQDILLINSAQKLALFRFLPNFSGNPDEIVSITSELEITYQEAQLYTVHKLESFRKEQEKKFHESEERYRDLFDNSSDLIHFVTPEGRILYVNKAWKDALGYNESELEGESIYFYVCSKDREMFRRYRNLVLEGNRPAEDLRISFLSKDNREIVAEGTVTCKSTGDRVDYTRGIFRDVTRRVQNEEKLQFYTQQVLEREEKIKQLIENAPDAIIVINESGLINVWNPKAENIFGWKAVEVLDKSLTDTIIPEQYREAHNLGMQRLLRTGETRVLNKTIEVTALKKNGQEFFVSLNISRATLPNGSLFIAFLRDISEQKKSEQELEQQRMRLERTNAELEQYAWVASHDLKEPLRKIRTYSDILMQMPKEDLPEEAWNRLKKIQESAERMDTLIEAILLYSHSTGDQEIELVNLDSVLKEVLSDLEITINTKKARIRADKLPIIEGIPFQLRQLFQNLVGNALKYNRTDVPPQIDIETFQESGGFRITVSDNGIGFNPEFAAKIFQVFQRLVTKQEYEGTGIGLALCKKIVENHGGTIEAESKEGIGSKFIIQLPEKFPSTVP